MWSGSILKHVGVDQLNLKESICSRGSLGSWKHKNTKRKLN